MRLMLARLWLTLVYAHCAGTTARQLLGLQWQLFCIAVRAVWGKA